MSLHLPLYEARIRKSVILANPTTFCNIPIWYYCLILLFFSFCSTAQDSLQFKKAFAFLDEAKQCYHDSAINPVCKQLYDKAYLASGNHPYLFENMLAFLIANDKYAIATEYLQSKRTDTLENGIRARHAYFRGVLQMKSGFGFFKDAYASLREANKYELWSTFPSFKFLSQIQNAFGYIKMIYSGPNMQNQEDYPHPNWIAADLIRSLRHFEQAIYFDPENQNALTNRDTLRAKIVASGMTLDEIKESVRPIPIDLLLRQYKVNQEEVPDSLDEVNINYLPDNKVFIANTLAKYQELLIVADLSGSMKEVHPVKRTSRFKLLRELVLYLFHEMNYSTRIGIVSVGSQCYDTPKLFYPAIDNARREIIEHINKLGPDGHTPLVNSITEGLSLLSAAEHPKAIFLISDGMETCQNPLDLCILARNIHSLGIDIHVISFLEPGQKNSENAFEIYNCMTQYSSGHVFQFDEAVIEEKTVEFDPGHQEVLLLPPIILGENLKNIRHFVVDLTKYFEKVGEK